MTYRLPSAGVRFGMRTITVALTGVLMMALSALPAQADAGIRPVGRLPIGTSDVSIVDESAQRIVVIGNSASGSIRIRSFDDGSLRLLRQVDLPSYSISTPPAFAWNARKRLLYLVAASTAKTDPTSIDDRLLIIDSSLEVVSDQPLQTSPAFVVKGLSYDDGTRLLFMAMEAKAGAGLSETFSVQVAAYDPVKAAYPWPTQGVPVTGCSMLQSHLNQAAIAFNRATQSIYVACAPGGAVLTTGSGFAAIAAVRVADPTHPATKLHQLPGAFAGMDSLADQHAGRMMMVSQGGGADANAVWVFDERHAVFVGSTALGGGALAIGLDNATGQVYAAIRGAILVASDRGMKIPQALRFALPAHTQTMAGTLQVISARRRFAIPLQDLEPHYGYPQGAPYYKVYEDQLAPYVDVPDPNPDLGTSDIPEVAGKSAAIYSGDGAASGLRIHEVGGFNGLLQNVLPNGFDWWGAVESNTGVKDGDRDVRASYIPHVQLDQQSASAQAVSQSADDSTRDAYSTVNDGKPWPHTSAACSDLGQGAKTAKSDGSSVECDAKHGQTTASASYQVQTLAQIPQVTVVVGSSNSSVEAHKDSAGGTVVRSEAVARNITLVGTAGVVQIGSVTSIALVRAHGRPGTAKADLTRVFEDVVAPGYSCAAACDLSAVLRSLDEVLGVGVRVEAPEPSIVQTPKGARASILLDPWQLQQDSVLANQDVTEQEVPALRISFVVDRTERARFVLDFASVQATANYGIYSIASDFPSFPPPPVTPTTQPTSIVSKTGPSSLAKDFFALIRHPGSAWRLLMILPPSSLLAAAMWGLFGLPILVAGRRRHLLRLVRNRA